MEEIEEWENILVPTASAARQTSILPWNMRIKSEDFSDGIMENSCLLYTSDAADD